MNIEDPLRLAYVLATLIDMKPADKQALLEENDLLKKLEIGGRRADARGLAARAEGQDRVAGAAGDDRRAAAVLPAPAAQGDSAGARRGRRQRARGAAQAHRGRASCPKSVHASAMREVDRLARMSAASPEYQMLRTYIDWLLDVPWAVTTEDRIDPVEARKVLDEDHYDLDKVKERIVEYLAVRKLKGDMKGPILCFVGPPGVGKTSLGQSIARAMSRKFVRISLGGVRDEAEIRGHRRTYIGSIPGRIVQALKQAGRDEPGVHARRDRQGCRRLSGRSGGGAARSARPGAEPCVPRPLPRGAGRSVASAVHRHVEPAGHDSSGAARSDGDHSALRIQRGREGPHRPALSAAAADRPSTACRRRRWRSPTPRCGW